MFKEVEQIIASQEEERKLFFEEMLHDSNIVQHHGEIRSMLRAAYMLGKIHHAGFQERIRILPKE